MAVTLNNANNCKFLLKFQHPPNLSVLKCEGLTLPTESRV